MHPDTYTKQITYGFHLLKLRRQQCNKTLLSCCANCPSLWLFIHSTRNQCAVKKPVTERVTCEIWSKNSQSPPPRDETRWSLMLEVKVVRSDFIVKWTRLNSGTFEVSSVI
ncbi:hypothetical protein F2P81_004965 [Scophthalmus maximus]|uniref:Uncharacterized protein n=1 Tax=Scophthalmus maximus TaxID=52904 RepID=A0A6A4TGP5_SCOMX|nr:hypothetical protein F2P81_004965 [Scophthalmus maximus]